MSFTKGSGSADARTEAVEWFVALQAAGVARADQEAFADWLRRSPVHVEEFLELASLRGNISCLPELRAIDVPALLSQISATGENLINVDFPSRPAKRSHREPRRRGVRLAAAAAAMAFIAIGVFSIGPIHTFFGAERYDTAIGEQRSVTLADGSHVKLNVQSSLTVKVNDAIRDVRLSDGEALFQVAKDASRPFRVHTPQTTIEAKGTLFNVHVVHGQTIIALLEGHVEVRTVQGAPPVMLEPGQQITIAARGPERPAPRYADLKTVTAWTERRLVFEDTPLSDVIEEFNRYSRQPFVIEDPSLRAKRVTVSFESDSARNFGASLAATGALRVTPRPDGTWLIER